MESLNERIIKWRKNNKTLKGAHYFQGKQEKCQGKPYNHELMLSFFSIVPVGQEYTCREFSVSCEKISDI